MAFMVDNAKLQMGGDAGPLVRSEVTPLLPFFSSPNNVETITEGSANQTMVLLMTHYPGWQVFVDGKAQTLKNVSGYMAVDVQPGVHKYTFLYTPRPFFIGLIISVIATVIVLGLFISDLKFNRQEIKEKWRAFWDGLKKALQRIPRMKGKHRPMTGEAVYRDGSLQPSMPLELEEGSSVRVTVESQIGFNRGKAAWQHWVWATADLITTIWRAIPLEMALFTLAIGLYLSTRLIGLANFPIYFFTDEAVQTVMAEDFVHDGLRNYEDELLPTYFNKGSTYNLSSVSVYLQVIPYLVVRQVGIRHTSSVGVHSHPRSISGGADPAGYLQAALLVVWGVAAFDRASLVPAFPHGLRDRGDDFFLCRFLVFLPALPVHFSTGVVSGIGDGGTGILHLQPWSADHRGDRRIPILLRPALSLAEP